MRATIAPEGAICNNRQLLAPSAKAYVLKKIQVPPTAMKPYVRCRNLCLKDLECLSFSWDANQRACFLYSRTINKLGVKAGTSGGRLKDDISCFEAQCPTATVTCTTHAASPTLMVSDGASDANVFDDATAEAYDLKKGSGAFLLPMDLNLFDTKYSASSTVWLGIGGVSVHCIASS